MKPSTKLVVSTSAKCARRSWPRCGSPATNFCPYVKAPMLKEFTTRKLPEGCRSFCLMAAIQSWVSTAGRRGYSTGLHRFSPTSKSSCPSAIHINCWGLPHGTVCIWTRPGDQSGWNPLGWKLLAGLNDFLNGHWVIQRSSHSPSRSKLWHHLGAPLTGDAPKRWQQQLWIHTNGIKNA